MTETFNRSSAVLADTDATDVYQAPNAADTDRAVVLSCMVANVDAQDSCDVTVAITNADDTEIAKLANTFPVEAGAKALEIIPNKLVLKRGEKLRATASVGGDLHVTVSALEIS